MYTHIRKRILNWFFRSLSSVRPTVLVIVKMSTQKKSSKMFIYRSIMEIYRRWYEHNFQSFKSAWRCTLADPLTKGECDERCIHMALPIANRKHIAILTVMMFLHSRQFRYMKHKLAFWINYQIIEQVFPSDTWK